MPTRQFELITLQPKEKKVGRGVLSVDQKTGDATFFEGDGAIDGRILATMRRTRLESAAAHGIMLSGHEPVRPGRDGREQLAYQEWWLRYLTD